MTIGQRKGEDAASPRGSDVPGNPSDSVADSPGSVAAAPERPLFLVRGDATPEEIAALTVVLQSVAAGSAAPPAPRPRPQWSAPHRAVRRAPAAGPGAWRASALPH